MKFALQPEVNPVEVAPLQGEELLRSMFDVVRFWIEEHLNWPAACAHVRIEGHCPKGFVGRQLQQNGNADVVNSVRGGHFIPPIGPSFIRAASVIY